MLIMMLIFGLIIVSAGFIDYAVEIINKQKRNK